jgi:hypothetical protein
MTVTCVTESQVAPAQHSFVGRRSDTIEGASARLLRADQPLQRTRRMEERIQKLAVSVAVACGLAVVACGSSNSNPSPTQPSTPPLTQA